MTLPKLTQTTHRLTHIHTDKQTHTHIHTHTHTHSDVKMFKESLETQLVSWLKVEYSKVDAGYAYECTVNL